MIIKQSPLEISAESLLVIVILFPIFAPIASFSPKIRMILIGIWALLRFNHFFINLIYYLYPYILWLIANLLLFLLGNWYFGHYSFDKYIYDAVMYMLPIIMYFTYSNNNKFQILMKKIIIISLFVGTTITIILNIAIPGASRILASGLTFSDLSRMLSKWGCKDFSGIYASTLMLPVFMQNISITRKNPWEWTILFFLTLVMIFFSSYTTALLLSIFAIVSHFVSRHRLISIILGIILIVLVITLTFDSFVGKILLTISNWFGETSELGKKIYDVYMTIRDDNAYGTALSRNIVYETSLRSFRSSIFLGAVVYDKGISGDHSSIFDLLACYGIIGLIFYAWHFIRIIGKYKKSLSININFLHNKPTLNTVYIMYVILAVLNPIILSTPIVWSVFLASPMMLKGE